MDIQGIQSARPWTLWLWPVVFAAVIFAAELLGPRNGDTVEYSFVVPADRNANQYQYVGSLADLAHSQANHYMHENGRVAVHAVAQPLCSIDRHAPWVFPLLDAALFLLLVGLTVRLLRWSQSPGTMLLLSAAIYIYIEPVRTDIAYQVNYLWVTALVTGFLLLFFSHRRVRRWWIWPLLALFGFVTGESNEAFTAGIGLALVVFLMRRHRRRVTLSQLCLAISFAVGFFVNVLAPGNQVRLDSFTVPSTGELVANLLAWNWLFVPLVAVVSWRSRRGWDVRAYVRRFSFAIVAVCALAFVLLMVGTTYLGACMGMRWAPCRDSASAARGRPSSYYCAPSWPPTSSRPPSPCGPSTTTCMTSTSPPPTATYTCPPPSCSTTTARPSTCRAHTPGNAATWSRRRLPSAHGPMACKASRRTATPTWSSASTTAPSWPCRARPVHAHSTWSSALSQAVAHGCAPCASPAPATSTTGTRPGPGAWLCTTTHTHSSSTHK